MMSRPPEHVFQFFMAELGTEGSIDGNQRLVIRGKVRRERIFLFLTPRPDHGLLTPSSAFVFSNPIGLKNRLPLPPTQYVPKYIESLLRKYITEYVTCKMCRSAATELTKDTVSRLFFCNCAR